MMTEASNIVTPAAPDVPQHGLTPVHIHSFALPVTKKGYTHCKFNEMVKSWLPNKGAIYFVSAEVFVKFSTGGGEVWVAWTAEKDSMTTVEEIMTYPNRKCFGSTDMNYSDEKDGTFKVTEGYTTLIFPTTGDRPQTTLTVYNNKAAAAYITIFFTVRPTGPFIYRWKIEEGTGIATALGGF